MSNFHRVFVEFLYFQRYDDFQALKIISFEIHLF